LPSCLLAAAKRRTRDADRVIVWFRHQPIAGYDGRTALRFVEAGHADAVLTHLGICRTVLARDMAVR
jgi:hypothetical protein